MINVLLEQDLHLPKYMFLCNPNFGNFNPFVKVKESKLKEIRMDHVALLECPILTTIFECYCRERILDEYKLSQTVPTVLERVIKKLYQEVIAELEEMAFHWNNGWIISGISADDQFFGLDNIFEGRDWIGYIWELILSINFSYLTKTIMEHIPDWTHYGLSLKNLSILDDDTLVLLFDTLLLNFPKQDKNGVYGYDRFMST